jgi:hypothetical protein
MLPVNAVGERLEGKPHEPFDGGAEETRWSRPVARLRSTLHFTHGWMGRGWKRSNRHRASPSPDSSANVCDRLPDALASTVARRMRATDHQPDPLIAQAELEALARTLDRSHPGAAASLRQGWPRP